MSRVLASRKASADKDAVKAPKIQDILGDYTIHTTGTSSNPISGTIPGTVLSADQDVAYKSEPEDGAIDPTTEPHPRVEGVISPQWWPRNWRNMPEFAPINRDLDHDVRPSGANAVEKTMIIIVLNGCALLSTYAYLWRNTFGRIHDRIDKVFNYEIGGEY